MKVSSVLLMADLVVQWGARQKLCTTTRQSRTLNNAPVSLYGGEWYGRSVRFKIASTGKKYGPAEVMGQRVVGEDFQHLNISPSSALRKHYQPDGSTSTLTFKQVFGDRLCNRGPSTQGRKAQSKRQQAVGVTRRTCRSFTGAAFARRRYLSWRGRTSASAQLQVRRRPPVQASS